MREIITKDYFNEFLDTFKRSNQKSKTFYIETKNHIDKIIYEKYQITKLNHQIEQKLK